MVVMNIKINSKLLSVPPYLSTSWSEISALQVAQNDQGAPLLLVTLKNGEEVAIPDLPSPILGAAFELHARSLEQPMQTAASSTGHPLRLFFNMLNIPSDLSLPLFQALARSEQVSDLQGAIEAHLTHNPELAESPDLPEMLTSKMREIAEMGGEELKQKFIPIEGCNCPHCQIGRLFGATDAPLIQEEEEIVSDADLSFRSWDIQPVGERLYRVRHPLDKDETYHVFLGTPVGCTCGQSGCEHLHAVLRS